MGQNIVCLLWMETLIKNKAKQNKNAPHTAHGVKPVTRGKEIPMPWPQWQQQDVLSDKSGGDWKSPGGASVTQGGMLLTGSPAPPLFTAASPVLFAARPETPPLTLHFFRVQHCLPYEVAQEVTLQGCKLSSKSITERQIHPLSAPSLNSPEKTTFRKTLPVFATRVLREPQVTGG